MSQEIFQSVAGKAAEDGQIVEVRKQKEEKREEKKVKKKIRRRRLVPHPRCTLQITLTSGKRKFQKKTSFWWPERSWDLQKAIAKYLDGAKFGADYARLVQKRWDKREKTLRARRTLA
ncbi:MAG: hypothetical protein LAP21_08345 [Acidobacteriia bacterium]|nr:hypothetical protein [Terriglobia bacterium]